MSVANALCGQYVSQLGTQVHNEQTNEINGLRSQIASLEHQLKPLTPRQKRRLPAKQRVDRSAIVDAIVHSQQILTVSLSLPPDNISVLSSATVAVPQSTKPSLSKALIVAAAAGLLASFLLILGVEAMRGRQTAIRRPGDEVGQQEE